MVTCVFDLTASVAEKRRIYRFNSCHKCLLFQREFSSNYIHHSLSGKPDSSSAGKEIPRLSWKQDVHCCVHESPPLGSVLSQMNSVHIHTPCFYKFHSDVLPSKPRSPKWSLLFRFSEEMFYTHLVMLPFLLIAYPFNYP
jgi:hypothetical protein